MSDEDWPGFDPHGFGSGGFGILTDHCAKSPDEHCQSSRQMDQGCRVNGNTWFDGGVESAIRPRSPGRV